MVRQLPTGTVTLLFTDVEGSTRLLHELGAEAYAEALAHHRGLIREACAAHGGVEVDTQGDAFFVARLSGGRRAKAGGVVDTGPIVGISPVARGRCHSVATRLVRCLP
jgi:class 3 adenylate cyclase